MEHPVTPTFHILLSNNWRSTISKARLRSKKGVRIAVVANGHLSSFYLMIGDVDSVLVPTIHNEQKLFKIMYHSNAISFKNFGVETLLVKGLKGRHWIFRKKNSPSINFLTCSGDLLKSVLSELTWVLIFKMNTRYIENSYRCSYYGNTCLLLFPLLSKLHIN